VNALKHQTVLHDWIQQGLKSISVYPNKKHMRKPGQISEKDEKNN